MESLRDSKDFLFFIFLQGTGEHVRLSGLLMVQPMLDDVFALKFFLCRLNLLDLRMGT